MIKLTNRFKSDLKLNNISLQPFIIIGNNDDIETNNAICIAGKTQVKRIIKEKSGIAIGGKNSDVFNVPVSYNFDEYDLNFSGLLLGTGSMYDFFMQSSGEINKKGLAVRSIDITVSNFEIDGVRFGDNQLDYYSKDVRIFYASNDDAFIKIGRDGRYFFTLDDLKNNSMIQVFKGFIQEVQVSKETVKLVAEDDISRLNKKQLPPKENVMTDDLYSRPVLEYDRGKTIPMVYGEVPRSPLIKAYKGSFDEFGVTGYKLVADLDTRVRKIVKMSGAENYGISVKSGSSYFELFETGENVGSAGQVLEYGLFDKDLAIKERQFIPPQDTNDGTVILTLGSAMDGTFNSIDEKQPLANNVLFVRSSPRSNLEVSAEMETGQQYPEAQPPVPNEYYDSNYFYKKITNLSAVGDESVLNSFEDSSAPLSNQTYNNSAEHSLFTGYALEFEKIDNENNYWTFRMFPSVKFKFPDANQAKHPASKMYVGVNPDCWITVQGAENSTNVNEWNGNVIINLGMNDNYRLTRGVAHGELEYQSNSSISLHTDNFSGDAVQTLHFGSTLDGTYASSPVTYVGWVMPSELINADGEIVSSKGSSFDSIAVSCYVMYASSFHPDVSLANPNINDVYNELLADGAENGRFIAKVQMGFNKFELSFNLLLKDAIQSDFYGHVYGRNVDVDGLIGANRLRNPMLHIADLFATELGYTHDLEWGVDVAGGLDWSILEQYGIDPETISEDVLSGGVLNIVDATTNETITVNAFPEKFKGQSFTDLDSLTKAYKRLEDKIAFDFSLVESKPFLEVIDSMMAYLPIFASYNHLGRLKFTTVNDEYFKEDYTGAVTINATEIIKYKFRRTKTDDIVTKVDIRYNYDYSDNETKSVFSKSLDGNYLLDFYEYYGINTNHIESTLEIESPFIRDDGNLNHNKESLDALADWIIGWHCNDHIMVDLTLPLSYLELECGDLIKFIEHPDGIKPFGIDITRVQIPNYVYRYPLFMVFKTKINNSNVVVSAIQLNDLKSQQAKTSAWTNFWLAQQQQEIDEDEIIDEAIDEPIENAIYGCTNPDYAEYYHNNNVACVDDLANCIDDGSCQDIAVVGCTDLDAENYNADVNVSDNSLCEYFIEPHIADKPRLLLHVSYMDYNSSGHPINMYNNNYFEDIMRSVIGGKFKLLYASRYEEDDGVYDDEFIANADVMLADNNFLKNFVTFDWKKPALDIESELISGLMILQFNISASHAGDVQYKNAGVSMYSGYWDNYTTWNGLSNIRFNLNNETPNNGSPPIYFQRWFVVQYAPDLDQDHPEELENAYWSINDAEEIRIDRLNSGMSEGQLEWEGEGSGSVVVWLRRKYKWLIGRRWGYVGDNWALIEENTLSSEQVLNPDILGGMQLETQHPNLRYNYNIGLSTEYGQDESTLDNSFAGGYEINLDFLAIYMWYLCGYKVKYYEVYKDWVEGNGQQDIHGVNVTEYPHFQLKIKGHGSGTGFGEAWQVSVGSYIWDDPSGVDNLKNASMETDMWVEIPFPLYLVQQIEYIDVSRWNVHYDCSMVGDINRDGIINILDVISLVEKLLEYEPMEPDEQCRADFNQDGTVNILDVIALVNHILGGS